MRAYPRFTEARGLLAVESLGCFEVGRAAAKGNIMTQGNLTAIRVLTAGILWAAAVFALVATGMAYSEFSSELHGSRLPEHFQRKMLTMQLAPLLSGAAAGAAISLLTRFRGAWLWGLLSMLPLTLFMIRFCLK